MVPELGHLALILALCFAASQVVVTTVGSYLGNISIQRLSIPLTQMQFYMLCFSLVCLGYAFLHDDFSVAYVANNSNSALPDQYKISAIWGAHEGSLLLWVAILGGWSWAVSIWSKNLPDDILAKVLAVLGIVSVGFILFTLLTSNPFDRVLPNSPVDGKDLNPLLQDFGLIVHPPMLYMGYVGFSVAFAFSIAALLSGRLDAAWARWSRPWTNMAWVFLTIGIALGSWWAYYELGWGGWWFWDPVENASFMPWIVGTALIHSLAATEKRGVFKSWTVLLAIFAFSLSLLGAFLVRSGVLTSVHAFATDPERGLFLLMLLGICIGGSLMVYALKAPTVKSASGFTWLSREVFLLLNNVVMVVAASLVLIGTLYPLVFDFLGLGKISVGPPFFNATFVPLMALIAALLGVGITSRWKNTNGSMVVKKLYIAFGVSLIVTIALPFILGLDLSWGLTLGILMASWVTTASLADLYDKAKGKSGLWAGMRKLTRSYYGMLIAHIGFAFTVAGICSVSLFSIEENVRLTPGDRKEIAGYVFEFNEVKRKKGPNYVAEVGYVTVYYNGEKYTVLKPEKRRYNVQTTVMTEAAIDPGFLRDLYVSLGEPLGGDAWAVRLQFKPLIRWIWLGTILMGVGGILAVSDRRYRMKVKNAKAQKAQVSGPKPATAS